MRVSLIFLLGLLVFNSLVDLYIYVQARCRCRWRGWSRLQLWSAIGLTLLFIAAIAWPYHDGHGHLQVKTWLLLIYLSVYLPKIVAVAFDLVAQLPLLWHGGRWQWLTKTGIVVALAICAAVWWGALINRFRIEVRHVDLTFKELPPAFNGFTIAQISDLHLGGFGSDTTFVNKLVARVDSLHPDVIVFTGDVVSTEASEMTPFIGTLRHLKAPYGVYAILGNHDYGDYRHWPTEKEKRGDMRRLKAQYRATGITLLCDSTVCLHAAGDSIALIGVENIGEPPFKVYGSLQRAYPRLDDDNFKVLLTHNPRHWTDSIAPDCRRRVALTLSGHTHAMQIAADRYWSPSQWRYDTWGGLYTDPDSCRFLYVNIGAGTVGPPFRIGATPEITIIKVNSE